LLSHKENFSYLDKMKYFIEIFFYLIFFVNKSEEKNENILFLNHPSNISYPPYTILTSNYREKRDKFSWFNPLKHAKIIHDQCDEHIYTKLYSCSHLSECT
jgi:hypothetical protein